MTAPIDTRKLYVQVADSITRSIQSGEYSPGARLSSERELAVEFKVSRTTVREAMIALEIRGLVEARPGSGIYVSEHPPTDPEADDLDIGAFELTEARRLFEGEAAALAAAIITDEQLQEIEAILADMLSENARKQNEEKADRSFHIAIARATRNAAVTTVVEILWDMRYKSPLCVDMLERARRAGLRPRVSEHRRIFAALRERNPKAARSAMRDHLRRVIDAILAATETDAVDRARKKAVSKRHEYTRRLSV
jgi:GntR family transcriptional regulator, hexuronate regulon transcriptional repressor